MQMFLILEKTVASSRHPVLAGRPKIL